MYHHFLTSFHSISTFIRFATLFVCFFKWMYQIQPTNVTQPFCVWISFLFSTNRIDEKKNLEKISKMMMMMMTFSFLSPPLYMMKIFFFFYLSWIRTLTCSLSIIVVRWIYGITDNKNKEFFFLLNLDIQNVRHFKWQLQQQHAKDFCLEDS